ncbi:MAG: lysostaphin resistance A-like protein [Bacteroidota bacterium]
MQNILKNTSLDSSGSTPWLLLLILGGYVVAGLFLFSFLAQAIILPFFDFDLQKALTVLTPPYQSDEARLPLLIIQGVTSLGAFLLIPIFFVKRNLNLPTKSFFTYPSQLYQPLLMTIFIMFSFMVVNSIFIEWNRNIVFPEFMHWFEDYVSTKEGELELLTNYITSFENFGQFILGFIIIAILPAIGEELLFRGLIQNLFGVALKNIHLAIWLTAFIFGAIHMQFYGMVPRILLGALFGYLYFWSGHLTIAMFAHFINNGFTLVLLYLAQEGLVDYDPVSKENTAPFMVVIVFFVIVSALLLLYRNYFRTGENG